MSYIGAVVGESLSLEAARRNAIADVLREYGDFAHGGESAEDTANEWLWATPELVRAMLEARCWDGCRALLCPAVGLTPEMLSQRVEVCGYVDTIGYALANGDLSVSQARALAAEVAS